MFTGIVEEVGTVHSVHFGAESCVFWIRGPLVTTDAEPGDSIAVSGTCLTVTDLDHDRFRVDVMKETLDRTTLGSVQVGTLVNLERAVAAGQRLSGHIVQGHVDGTGVIGARTPGDHWELVRISCPDTVRPYLIEKGSIAVDGVSLTAFDLTETTFTVSLIPTTLERSTLGQSPVGTHVNLEADVIGKYVVSTLHNLTKEHHED